MVSDAESYFDKKAIDRRIKHGYPLNHYSDLPVRSDYIMSVESIVDSTRYTFRWMNAVSCYATAEQMQQVLEWPFVDTIYAFQERLVFAEKEKNLNDGQMALAKAQIERMGGHLLHEHNLTGKGMRIAILDAGFPNVGTMDAFKHIVERQGIIDTYDFINNKRYALKGNPHGTMVLSNIGGIVNGVPLGMAYDADFLLARTESLLKEGLADEESWLAAMEWADKKGADIINSSLGYTSRLYFRKDMNGMTSLISRAANMAAAKGILVVNSAGNEGSNDEWVTIGAPADADSVLAVGGISPWTNMHVSWSSYGPSADKRLKPNVSAFGHSIVSTDKEIGEATGTSFASPLTAGFAACIWQQDTTLTNMELFKRIESSGDLYPYFDYAHGYGIPQASFFLDSADNNRPTFRVEQEDSLIKIVINEEDFTYSSLIMNGYYSDKKKVEKGSIGSLNGKFFNIPRKSFVHYKDYAHSSKSTGAKSNTFDFFFFHIENQEGYLDVYYVIGVEQTNVLNYTIKEEDKGKIMRFHYKGYTKEIQL